MRVQIVPVAVSSRVWGSSTVVARMGAMVNHRMLPGHPELSGGGAGNGCHMMWGVAETVAWL
jgi:hypothetical protein